MLYHCFAGSETFSAIGTDAKNHNIAANLSILTRVKIDKDLASIGYFN